MKKKVWDHALGILFPGANKILLKMKLTLCIILFSFLGAMATDLYSQTAKLSLDLKDTSVKEVLGNIENQSEFFFLYSEKIIDVNRNVNIEVHESTIEKILDRIFAGTNVNYTVKGRQIVLTTPESNLFETFSSAVQQRSISGKITDSTGAPLPGVSVVVKGTMNGTITNSDGQYSISNIPANSTLMFSFVGMKSQEIATKGKTSLDVVLLEETVGIEEVVAVGYGTQKKVTLTGSVITAKGADIVKSPALNVVSSLAGRLPGVIINNRTGEPGNENTSLYIRGRSTTGNNSALVVVDGVERGGLGEINPNDIESISVLKDASAAIYGARAANGVILVTTKRGNSSAPVINFTYNQGFSQPTRKPKMADSYTFFSVYNEIEASEGRSPRYTEAELQKFKEGTDPNYANIDWYDYIIKDWTPQHKANASISGGGERAKYYVSLGQVGQNGMYIHDTRKYNQYNFRSNLDVKVTESLTVGANLAGRYDDKHSPYQGANNLNSHIFLYQPNWVPYWPGTNFMTPNRDSENILNWVTDNQGYIDQNLRTIQSSMFFKWEVPWLKGLIIEGNGSYDASSTFRKTFQTPDYVYFKDKDSGELVKGRSGVGPNLASLTDRAEFSSLSYYTIKGNYERKFGKHNVGLMVGYEQQQTKGNSLVAARTDYISTTIPQIFAGSSDKNKQSNDGSAWQGARQNIFSRLSYDYAGKYLAQFSFRRDGSPNFPIAKRYGYFPSASVGWRMSEESFMKDLDFVNNLKIRGSWGMMGNDLVNAFQYLSTYGYGRNYVIGGTDVAGLVETNVPNPNITWETAKTWDIGLDATLWNGLLGIEFDYFKTRRSDILTKRTAIIPSYTGLTLPDENIGIVDNKGFELVLSHERKIRDFQYNISANVSFARNKVIFSDEQPAAEPYQLATGKPIGSYLLYKSLGIFKDQAAVNNYPHLAGTVPGDIIYEDVNKDGQINSRDRIRINQTNIPEIVYGFNMSAKYKGFDLALLFQGQENAKQSFGGLWFPVMSYSFGNYLAWRAEDRWSPTNTAGSMPRASYGLWNNSTDPSYNSTHWLVKSGFLRLKNVELGYNFPKRICSKMKINDLRLSVSASNPFIVYDHMKDLGFDPETSDFWYYQQQRILNFGINLTL